MARALLMFPFESTAQVYEMKTTDDSVIDEQVAFLAEVYPETDLEVITQYLLRCGDLEQTLVQLQSFERVKDDYNGEGGEFELLKELFPECEPDFLMSLVGANSGCNVDELCDIVMQQLVALEQKAVSKRRKYVQIGANKASYSNLQSSNFFKDKTPVLNVSFKEALKEETEDHSKSSSAPPQKGKRVPFKYDFGVDPPEEENAAFYRDLLKEIVEERGQLYAKAARAYAESGFGGRSAAAYYSQQARDLSKDIDFYRKRAVYATFLVHNPEWEYSNQIDLHGLAVAEALPLLSAFLQHHLRGQGGDWVKVVTGSGRRSKNGVRLRPQVFHLLKRQGWRFNFNSLGMFIVFRN